MRSKRERLSIDAWLFGFSPEARETRRLIHQVALTDLPILFEGESGTGKEGAARWVHSISPFASGQFVRLAGNALSVSETDADDQGTDEQTGNGEWAMIDLAHDGSLYLDGIEALSDSAQRHVCAIMQEHTAIYDSSSEPRPFRARIITSLRTVNKNPSGNLREALASLRPEFLYSINVATFRLPALRSRKDELPHLAADLLARQSHEFSMPERALSAEAIAALKAYAWPGNLREFREILTSFALTGSEEMLIRKVCIGDTSVERAA